MAIHPGNTVCFNGDHSQKKSFFQVVERLADSMGDFVAYKRFLLVWLLTGIVLPGFILYEKSAAINDIIWIRSDLKSVAEQRALKSTYSIKKFHYHRGMR